MKRTGTRFRPRLAQDHYDAIITGSGIGGLTTAALLSKLGKRVCVLEQHYTAGGYTHSYEREGYEWDVGVHYIGEVHKPWSVIRRVFDVISDGNLDWAPMDAHYDRIILGEIRGAEVVDVMTAMNTGRMHATTSASRHSMENRMASAPTIVSVEMSRSSGPWCASSVISNRSVVRRLMSWPVRLWS